MSYATPPCPADASHGRLLDLASERYAWFCPHRGHDGISTPFFTTDLVPVPRSGRVLPVPSGASTARARRVSVGAGGQAG